MGVPHSRQEEALRWTGLLQRGQTRRPASNLTDEGGGEGGWARYLRLSPGMMDMRSEAVLAVAIFGGLSANWALQRSRVVRSTASSSSVRASGLGGLAGLGSKSPALADSGTGTIRPHSGHLPASGRSLAGTFSRRPQGQTKRMNPSPGSIAAALFRRLDRRSRMRAPHLGQSTRSGSRLSSFSRSPQRHVTRGMG